VAYHEIFLSLSFLGFTQILKSVGLCLLPNLRYFHCFFEYLLQFLLPFRKSIMCILALFSSESLEILFIFFCILSFSCWINSLDFPSNLLILFSHSSTIESSLQVFISVLYFSVVCILFCILLFFTTPGNFLFSFSLTSLERTCNHFLKSFYDGYLKILVR
jgi:hypothetical protein